MHGTLDYDWLPVCRWAAARSFISYGVGFWSGSAANVRNPRTSIDIMLSVWICQSLCKKTRFSAVTGMQCDVSEVCDVLSFIGFELYLGFFTFSIHAKTCFRVSRGTPGPTLSFSVGGSQPLLLRH
jgi:hypothetical protein